MTNPLLFAFPADLQLEDLLIESETLTLLLTSSRSSQTCPDCAHASSRVHSHYRRRLTDLPSLGRAVQLYLKVRRFFCDNSACARQTFAEQFPEVAPAYARRTLRQGKTLQEIAFALGGRAGARLACASRGCLSASGPCFVSYVARFLPVSPLHACWVSTMWLCAASNVATARYSFCGKVMAVYTRHHAA